MLPLIAVHAAFALVCVISGAINLFSTSKGSRSHRVNGWLFVLSMSIVAVSAIGIQEINPGSFSWIHVLIPWTLFSMWYGIWCIKRYQITRDKKYLWRHKGIMITLYYCALVITGIFTFLPGRDMYKLFIEPWLV